MFTPVVLKPVGAASTSEEGFTKKVRNRRATRSTAVESVSMVKRRLFPLGIYKECSFLRSNMSVCQHQGVKGGQVNEGSSWSL